MKKQLTNPGLAGEHTGGYPIHADTVSAPHKENQGGITMMKMFPVIDMAATGANITRLRKDRGLTVRELQTWFGFEEPQAIYKWQQGKSLPSVDNLYALSALLEVSIEEILIPSHRKSTNQNNEQQAEACCSSFYPAVLNTAECGVHVAIFSRRSAAQRDAQRRSRQRWLVGICCPKALKITI